MGWPVGRVTGTELTRRRLLGAALGAAAVLALPGGSPARSATGACWSPRQDRTRLPHGVVGGYWTYWSDPPSLRRVHPAYNVLYLFHAAPLAPGRSDGRLRWPGPTSTTFRTGLAQWRSAGGVVLLTVGGADAQVRLPDREATRRVLASIDAVHTALGGFDGVDWNTYEADPAPPVGELTWASAQLKRAYGRGFAITTPPAPHLATDRVLCRTMVQAGVLDLVAPQCYDAPASWDPQRAVDTLRWWAEGLGQPDRLAIGMGLPGASAGSPTGALLATWRRVRAELPQTRGAYAWDLAADAAAGWPFAEQVGRAIRSGCPA